MKTSLTGVKPTNLPHIGNYFGAIRPAVQLASEHRGLYFIADYHALTSMRDPQALRASIYDVAATWLAAGLSDETLIYRQSAIPEVFELSWILSCLLAVGQLERGHAYKDALANGDMPNSGIFYYPVLMAADIILYDADLVPVGKDQKQHLELARDVAVRLNHVYGEGTVVVPAPVIADAPLVPGTDGHKMSKSRGNGIPLFVPPKKLRKMIMAIKTGSETLEEPKDPEGSTIVQLYRLVATESDVSELEKKLRAGGFGWGHAKEELFQALDKEISPLRERFDDLRANEKKIDEILAAGEEEARKIAKTTIARVRAAVGID